MWMLTILLSIAVALFVIGGVLGLIAVMFEQDPFPSKYHADSP
jgi:hypothetical protein